MTPRRTGNQRPYSHSGFGNVSVPGTRAGAIVSIGLAFIAWFTIPLARPFIAGAAALGLLIGVLLWWKHKD